MWFTTLILLTLAVSARSYTVDSETLKTLLRELEEKEVRDTVHNDPFKKACGGVPAEIVFIVDDSRSIYPPHFEKQIEFIGNFVRIFTIGSNAVRVGVVTYGDKIIKSNTFLWSTYMEEERLVDGISKIKFSPNDGASTQTGLAIKYAYDKMFRYARPGIVKLAIVITDGESSEPTQTLEQAKNAREHGVTFIAIGVGNRASRHELDQITGDPNRVFMISGYNVLQTIKKQLGLKACLPPTTTPAPTTPQMEQPCEKDIDVNFVFDSAMLGDQGTRDVIKFIQSSISDKELDKSNIRFGAVAGQCNKVYGFKLNQYRSKSEIMKHFDQFHKTALAPLLKETAEESFSAAHGGRIGARKVATIFLKGKLTDPSEMTARAEALRKSGIEVFLVKMDNMNSWSTLNTIAPQSNILDASTGTSMVHLSGEFSNRLCKRRT